MRRRDDENLPDAREHQDAQRIIDHRFVVERQQLLGDNLRYRVEARAGPARQDDSFHGESVAEVPSDWR